MNALTVNIHLLLVSFYQPNDRKYKVMIEKDAFPSDHYAIQSQIQFHGYDPKLSLIELAPRKDEKVLRHEDIISAIENALTPYRIYFDQSPLRPPEIVMKIKESMSLKSNK